MNEAQRLNQVAHNPTVRELAQGSGFLRVATRDAGVGLPAASERYAYCLAGLRNVPGTSAGKLYCCLPSSAAAPVWAWVEVATG